MKYFRMEGPPKQAYDRMVSKLKQTCMNELGLAEKDVVIRELRPDDLGVTGAWTVNLSATGWITYINAYPIANNRFIGIYGVSYPQSAVQAGTQVRIDAQGQTLRYWGVQDINMTENLEFYFDDPIEVIKQNTPVTIRVYARSVGATERVVILGVVAEKEGLLVKKGVN